MRYIVAILLAMFTSPILAGANNPLDPRDKVETGESNHEDQIAEEEES